MRQSPNNVLFGLVIAAWLAVALLIGIQIWQRVADPLPADALHALRLVHAQVLDNHVHAQDADDLLYDAIEGMVRRLDRHSRFVRPDEAKAFAAQEIEGTYEGIGIVLVPDLVPLTVKFPLVGGPAERAGLVVGDRIVAVNGEDTSELSTAETRRRIVGPAGSPVELTLARGDSEPIDVRLECADVRTPAVKWTRLVDAEHTIGYLYVKDFQREVTAEFDAAVADLRQLAGGRLGGLIIDLRHNPGGLLDEAIAIANRMVPAGVIVSLKRRDTEVVEEQTADPRLCSLPDVPIAVLIDRSSASASEVVAGALQDHGRARLVGTRSHGKGVAQSIYRWPRRDFILKLTTQHYYTPSGRSIERSLRREGDGEGDGEGGIVPDLEVAAGPDGDAVIRTLRDVYEVPREYRSAVERLAAELAFEVDRPPGPDGDPQLAAAVELLRDAPPAAAAGGGQATGTAGHR